MIHVRQCLAIYAALVVGSLGCAGRRHHVASAPAPPADVTGLWEGVTTVSGSSRQAFALTLTQEGTSLAGQVTIDRADGQHTASPVTGGVAGDRVTWITGGRGFQFKGAVSGDRMVGMWSGTYVMVSPVSLSLLRRSATRLSPS